jgi:peroxiredoxin
VNSSPKPDSTDSNPNVPSSDSRFRLPPWAKIALIVAVIALSSLGYLTSRYWKSGLEPAGHAELDPEELARRTPVKDFTLTDSEGKTKPFSEFRGEVVILSFWASWCTPCLIELPTFAELDKKFRGRGLKIVTVNMDEGDEGMTFSKDFWAKNRFPFPSYFDKSKELARQFEVDMLPSNFVIDRKGRLVFSSFGANDWMSQQTLDFIDGLLLESDKDPQPESQASES